MMDPLTPRPEHKFTFGLWTVGNIGRDPFGGPTRAPITPIQSVEKLSKLGAYGVNLHDNDLVAGLHVAWGHEADPAVAGAARN